MPSACDCAPASFGCSSRPASATASRSRPLAAANAAAKTSACGAEAPCSGAAGRARRASSSRCCAAWVGAWRSRGNGAAPPATNTFRSRRAPLRSERLCASLQQGATGGAGGDWWGPGRTWRAGDATPAQAAPAALGVCVGTSWDASSQPPRSQARLTASWWRCQRSAHILPACSMNAMTAGEGEVASQGHIASWQLRSCGGLAWAWVMQHISHTSCGGMHAGGGNCDAHPAAMRRRP